MKELGNYKFIEVIKNLSFVKNLYVYGSRARGDNAERSDIDLAVNCPKATDREWAKVLDAVENADTLLEIDCVRFDKLKDDSDFKHRILSDKREL